MESTAIECQLTHPILLFKGTDYFIATVKATSLAHFHFICSRTE